MEKRPKKKKVTVQSSLTLAAGHLKRVKAARKRPDWADLAMYGLYCLEASVRAAVLKAGGHSTNTHWEKSDQASTLNKQYGLPRIDKLMRLLNEARKSEAYGDIEFDEGAHDADEIAGEIEEYYDAVTAFVSKK